jgi:hypothetical protein
MIAKLAENSMTLLAELNTTELHPQRLTLTPNYPPFKQWKHGAQGSGL